MEDNTSTIEMLFEERRLHKTTIDLVKLTAVDKTMMYFLH
jgi:hypothetical protein